LNKAVELEDVSPEVASTWREIKPFADVGRPRIRFLDRAEQQRLVGACDEGFGDLVRAALHTGARFSELARLTVADFYALNRTVLIVRSLRSKSKKRHVSLAPDAFDFFSELCADRDPGDLMLTRLTANGERVKWQNRPAQRVLHAAFETAKIAPAIFHELRHTAASTWIRDGVSLQVVSEQLGHRSIVITVKHYAHIAKDWKRAIFDQLPGLGLGKPDRAGRPEKQVVQ
jgi:integrase